jgi:hypothetical protein
LEIEQFAGAVWGAVLFEGGGGDREVNDRLGQDFVERDVPIRIVLFGERFEADGLQLVEGGEALARGVFVAGVAESAQDVSVLGTRQAVGIGHLGVNRGTNGPADILA